MVYKIKKWLHWNFGVHFFEPLGKVGVLDNEKDGKWVWCSFCGSKFRAHDYLFEKLYRSFKKRGRKG